jgi:hypothetical protein
LYTLNPAFFAWAVDNGFRMLGVENELINFRTAALHNGHFSKGGALTGLFRVNPFLQIRHSPEQGSYS